MHGLDLDHLAPQAFKQLLVFALALGGVGHQFEHFIQGKACLLAAADDFQGMQGVFAVVAVAIAQAPGADQAAGFVEADT
ncbi:hypothetical protein D3C77_166180 [compost metagenome]